ncbi:MAG TPA: glycosyltransferase family A protein [Candidatus Competibacteraceae bacterium]|nr:glycosyltransferase family A protein [Candidatus Competibacteraceae bacterium]
MNLPKVTIVIPVYNGEKYIESCIDSIINQDYPDIQIIIVDDGSTDRSAELIKKYERVEYYKQAQLGATVARNFGLKMAKGQFIKFLDADDFLAKNSISEQVAHTLLLGTDSIVYGYAELIDGSRRTFEKTKIDESSFNSQIVSLILNNITITLPLHKVEILKEIGGFDERLKSRQEWNLHIRIAMNGYKLVYRDTLVYHQRNHTDPNRISNRKWVVEKELENINYAFDSIKNSTDKSIADAWACCVWSIGRQFALRNNPQGAKVFFDKAKAISPNGHKRYLRLRYKFLSAIIGPFFAEKFYFILRRNLQKINI